MSYLRILNLVLLGSFCCLNQLLISATIVPIGVDEETNDAWRSSDIQKPYGDEDNIYGTDGWLIAQYPDGDENNTLLPPYAEITILGKGYEGVGAEQYQAKFDDVTQTGTGDVPDLVCGDYWANSGPTGTVDDFFEITLTEDTSFRLGVITDTTPEGPPGLIWEASRSVKVSGPDGIESDLVDAVGADEEWRDADVDYVIFDISGNAGDVFIVAGEQDERWEANALGGIFFDPPFSKSFEITQIIRNPNTGSITIEFSSSAGAVYGIDASTDLNTWDELDDGLIGNKDRTEFVDDFLAPENKFSQLFYRVRKLE
ncbi:MAG: hypothetical protein QF426_05300 [Verrucomicrobiales bacterium]|jgi:hypothetical protein|nr:hypothetical protein [Verrucomicrobiales bacterium]MEC7357629.1 hypothetical protein [Verrucomicrobiota bacterium]